MSSVGILAVTNPPDYGGVSSTGGDSGNSGWLSGVSDLFTAAAAGVAAGFKASNVPSYPTAGSGWVYNSATGQYYNPTTGQALTATGTLTSSGGFPGLTNSPLFLIILFLGALFLFRRPRSA
jgi:hypothetical protein